MTRKVVLMVLAALVAPLAVAQQAGPGAPAAGPAGAAAPAGQAGSAAPARPRPSPAQSTREFLGLGAAPDAEAAKRGAPIYTANCGFCHGPQGRGAEGPNLIYSDMVLKDVHGDQIVPLLQTGRPGKGMPPFAQLTPEQRRDVAEFVHQLVEDVANRGTYQVKDIVLGDPRKGEAYVASHCLGCHSTSGDLKGLGAKWRPMDLQRNWIMPPRASADGKRAITATVSTANGIANGRVAAIDDFRVVLLDDQGRRQVIVRNGDTHVELHDPLAPHVAMVGKLPDSDMINVTAYLETLK